MNIEELNERLKKDLVNVYKTILINGEWGIGKSYYLDNKISKIFNSCKVIKISLFGINSIQELRIQFIKGLNERLDFIKIAYSKIGGRDIGLGPFSLPLPSYEADIVKKLKKVSEKENIVIIIDDIERKSDNINMNELMGFFESISNIEKLKLILVVNENEMKEKDVFKTFKEKVIEKTYNVDKYSIEALEGILENEKKKLAQNINNKDMVDLIISTVKDFWIKYDCKNLRTLKKCMNFIRQNNEYLDITSYSSTQIKEIITIEMAVCSEKVLNKLNEKDTSKEHSVSTIISSPFTSNILNKYFFGESFYQKMGLVDAISEIFDDINTEKNLNKINSYYREQNNNSNDEIDKIDNFYLSDEQLKTRIEKFNKQYLNKINADLDINTWFKKFVYLYDCAKKIGMQELIDTNSIENTMDLYISECDISKGVRNILDPFLLAHIEDAETGKYYYKMLNGKVTKNYYSKLIEKLKIDCNNDVYDIDNIANLLSGLVEKELDDSTKEMIKTELKKNNYFIPNLNETINEKIWGYTHKIWEMMRFVDDKADFKEITDNLIRNASKSGKYRIEFLNTYYQLF